MRNQSAYERNYKKKMKPILEEQHKEALVNLEAHASSFTKEAQQKLFDDAAYDKKLLDSLVPVMADLGKEQGALALIFAGDEDGEFVLNARYQKYVEKRTLKMAQNFNDQTLEKLNKSLAEGIQAGENLDKLRKRVDEVYGDAERYRTLRVARTETLNASNEATNEAYRQTGYVKGKEWYVNPDACDLCTPFEGKTIGLDDTYVKEGESYEDASGEVHENSYDDIDSPPLHPNCRCTILPVR
jgi:SPP1 gp7 family putative phage head morphogenesis protein